MRALLLQVFYSIRSELMLIEQLEYNLLFRWFVGLETEAGVICRQTLGEPKYKMPRRRSLWVTDTLQSRRKPGSLSPRTYAVSALCCS